jgi:chromosome segregation ATPase
MKRLDETKKEVEKDVKWNQEAFDRVKKQIDDLEKKRADIKKRLPRAAQAEVDKLKQKQADFDEKMKKLDEKLGRFRKRLNQQKLNQQKLKVVLLRKKADQ